MDYKHSTIAETHSDRHPSTVNILKWLEPSPGVKAHGGPAAIIASGIENLTREILENIEQDSPELTAGLRKILEAKDCLVRAALDESPGFWTDR